MEQRRLMVGIDVGTTTTKVAAFTMDGHLVGAHTTGYPIDRPRPGWAERDVHAGLAAWRAYRA